MMKKFLKTVLIGVGALVLLATLLVLGGLVHLGNRLDGVLHRASDARAFSARLSALEAQNAKAESAEVQVARYVRVRRSILEKISNINKIEGQLDAPGLPEDVRFNAAREAAAHVAQLPNHFLSALEAEKLPLSEWRRLSARFYVEKQTQDVPAFQKDIEALGEPLVDDMLAEF